MYQLKHNRAKTQKHISSLLSLRNFIYNYKYIVLEEEKIIIK